MEYIHWFIDPVKDHYADFEGRVSVKTYWMFILLYVILAIVVSLVSEAINLGVLTTLFSLALLVPSIALASRRLHDINKSGWWQLIGLIPIVGWIILIVWLATKGDAAPNTYGSEPVVVPVVSEIADTSVVPTPDTTAQTEEEQSAPDTSTKEETEKKTGEEKQA